MAVKCGDLDLYISVKFVQHGIEQFAEFAICHIPRTHLCFFGPLMNQPHISYQLQKLFRILHNMKTSQNKIVLTCYRSAVRNANTPIGHNIAFLRNTLGIDIDNN